MKVGTKSLLFGVHQFVIHPLFVAVAWWKLYGFPKDYRLWIAFFVHDLGYWGKPNMDGPEGELHPIRGALFMLQWFGLKYRNLVMYHSRFLAKRHNQKPSKLCIADKLSIVLMPWWLYIPLALATGEIYEYQKLGNNPKRYKDMNLATVNHKEWYLSVQKYLTRWIEEHKDGKDDTWTPAQESVEKESDLSKEVK